MAKLNQSESHHEVPTIQAGEVNNRKYAASDYTELVAELTAIKEANVCPTLKWYKDHAVRPMMLFRTTGTLVIVLSVSVPLLATLPGVWSERLLPIVALAIAALTGVNSFFQWDSAWKNYRQTQYAIEHHLAMWDLALTAAKHLSDPDEAMATAIGATQKLLEDVRLHTVGTTGEYFEQIRLPQQAEIRT